MYLTNVLSVSVPLSINTVLEYIGEGKRCIVEGEELIKAGHIMECSVVASSASSNCGIRVVSFVLQTSGLDKSPHEVELVLDAAMGIDKLSCTCPAGYVCCVYLLCHRILLY